MPKASLVGGTSSYICTVFIQDSSKTTGAGLTGLTNSTCGTFYYKRSNGSASVSCTINSITTLGTYAGSATNAAFKEIDSTNMPGFYELHIPNNALASGALNVACSLKGGTNAAPIALEFELMGADFQDAVHLGLSSLPNASAGASSGLPVVGTHLPSALTGGGNLKADALAINGDTTAASNLAKGADGLVASTCASGCTTTSIVTNLTVATDSFYNGRVITFTSGSLAGQSAAITAYVGSTKTLTVAALTGAPANTDAFVIS